MSLALVAFFELRLESEDEVLDCEEKNDNNVKDKDGRKSKQIVKAHLVLELNVIDHVVNLRVLVSLDYEV